MKHKLIASLIALSFVPMLGMAAGNQHVVKVNISKIKPGADVGCSKLTGGSITFSAYKNTVDTTSCGRTCPLGNAKQHTYFNASPWPPTITVTIKDKNSHKVGNTMTLELPTAKNGDTMDLTFSTANAAKKTSTRFNPTTGKGDCTNINAQFIP